MEDPGKDKQSFKITLDTTFNYPDHILNKYTFLVTKSSPELKNAKWYHRLINKITFGKVFNLCYIWEAEIKE